MNLRKQTQKFMETAPTPSWLLTSSPVSTNRKRWKGTGLIFASLSRLDWRLWWKNYLPPRVICCCLLHYLLHSLFPSLFISFFTSLFTFCSRQLLLFPRAPRNRSSSNALFFWWNNFASLTDQWSWAFTYYSQNRTL